MMTGPSAVAQAAVFVAFPVAAAILGSIIAVLRPPGPKATSAVQHFAAGVVMAALAGEVLPDLRNEGSLPWAITGFVVGTAIMLALGALGRALERKQESSGTGLPVGFLVAVGIDLLLDGLLVGLGAALGAQQGLILTIALTIEILFIGLSVTITLIRNGLSRTRAVAITTALGLLTGVGALGGAAALGGASHQVLAFVLAVGAAALLYLVVEELLTEAHEHTETAFLGAMFFLGFLTIYVMAGL
ncbi:ZIP family metal transporter [Pseudarthrobacter sp. CC12]|uniref:ZIP family metal transporter n=1 Tax=Pseudarthrobacter sp. CC12 TaxID=3029193 RepID=UPI0032673FCA